MGREEEGTSTRGVDGCHGGREGAGHKGGFDSQSAGEVKEGSGRRATTRLPSNWQLELEGESRGGKIGGYKQSECGIGCKDIQQWQVWQDTSGERVESHKEEKRRWHGKRI